MLTGFCSFKMQLEYSTITAYFTYQNGRLFFTHSVIYAAILSRGAGQKQFTYTHLLQCSISSCGIMPHGKQYIMHVFFFQQSQYSWKDRHVAPLKMEIPIASTSSCKAAFTTISGVWRSRINHFMPASRSEAAIT
jgi:hypothetical protein